MLTNLKIFYSLFLKNLIVSYPSSKVLSYSWNLGSFLAILMVFQLCTGMILVLFYTPSDFLSFLSIDFLTRENLSGMVFRIFHLNGASFIFVLLYLHVMRGLMFCSFRLMHVWGSGCSMLLLCMLSAFLGYVLPYGQMSYWGASVITNLISVIPVFGELLVFWVWGGVSVNQSTLNFFFLAHFLIPLIIIVFVMFHLMFLHMSSSTSKILIQESVSKVKFFPFFVIKDIINFFFIFVFFGFIFFFPWKLGDPENWIKANLVVTPIHIQPEWYFLFAYAILRCIPNKMGGVIALVASVIILYFLVFNFSFLSKIKIFLKFFFVTLVYSFLILTWMGSCPVEEPYIFMSQGFSVMYFLSYLFLFF